MRIENSFLNIFNTNKTPNITRPNFTPRGNLAPLPYDTVSFSGAKKVSSSSDKQLVHSERGSVRVAQDIHDDLEYSYGHFKYLLSKTFDTKVIDLDSNDFSQQMLRSIDANKDKPVVAIVARKKSAVSIAEKMSSKHIRTKHCVKEKMNDLLGAKIILSGTSTQEGDYVLDKLTEAVKKGRIKISEVKNHGQENSKLAYATKTKLNKLVNTARKNGSPLCTYKDEPRDSGYLAIHILAENMGDGYGAEIQIMGLDVEEFKEIEDLCYKCHAGKGVDKKYQEIADLYKPYQNNKQFLADYLEYTKRAYAFERTKPKHGKNELMEHLHIPDDLHIPSALDFNNIARIKARIDRESRGFVETEQN